MNNIILAATVCVAMATAFSCQKSTNATNGTVTDSTESVDSAAIILAQEAEQARQDSIAQADSLAKVEAEKAKESEEAQKKIDGMLAEMEEAVKECEGFGLVPTSHFYVYNVESDLKRLKPSMTPEQNARFKKLSKRLAKL